MSTTTQQTAQTTIRAFLANIGPAFRLLAEYIRDRRNGVSSARKAMRLKDLSDAELNELGAPRDKNKIEYTFRDEI